MKDIEIFDLPMKDSAKFHEAYIEYLKALADGRGIIDSMSRRTNGKHDMTLALAFEAIEELEGMAIIAGVDMDRLYKECKYYAPTKYNDYGWYRKFEKKRF